MNKKAYEAEPSLVRIPIDYAMGYKQIKKLAELKAGGLPSKEDVIKNGQLKFPNWPGTYHYVMITNENEPDKPDAINLKHNNNYNKTAFVIERNTTFLVNGYNAPYDKPFLFIYAKKNPDLNPKFKRQFTDDEQMDLFNYKRNFNELLKKIDEEKEIVTLDRSNW